MSCTASRSLSSDHTGATAGPGETSREQAALTLTVLAQIHCTMAICSTALGCVPSTRQRRMGARISSVDSACTSLAWLPPAADGQQSDALTVTAVVRCKRSPSSWLTQRAAVADVGVVGALAQCCCCTGDARSSHAIHWNDALTIAIAYPVVEIVMPSCITSHSCTRTGSALHATE